MPSLWFVVPAAGRLELAHICLTQLRRTCDALEAEGIRASAVVVADDENLDTARELGFAWVRRDNRFVSRKFNDGIQLACDRNFNRFPVDCVVPVGSDDWVDWRLFVELPPGDTMVGFQRMSFVREDGHELTVRRINNEGGCGIRIWPRELMGPVGFRPADEDRKRGCDTSILVHTRNAIPHMRVEHRDLDPLQIVDWKTAGENLNPYTSLMRHKSELERDPFEVLAGRYPDEALEAMRAHYDVGLVAV
jgi:hypothetical protein